MKLKFSRVRTRNPLIAKILLSVVILMILLTLTGIIGYYYLTRPEYLRKQLLTLLKDQVNGDVKVDNAKFELNSGLTVYGLEIKYQNTTLIEKEIKIINIPELNIQINYQDIVESLVSFEFNPSFKLIQVEKPSFVVRFDKEGNWLDKDVFNLFESKSETAKTPQIPQIIVNGAEITLEFPMIFDEGRSNTVSNISFSIQQNTLDSKLFNIQGYAEAENLGKIEIEAILNQETNDIDIQIFNHNVVISRDRIKKFIPEIQSVYEEFIASAEKNSVGVNAEVTGRVLYTPNAPALLDLDVKLINGYAKYYRFPVPIEITAGHIKLRNHEEQYLPEFRERKAFMEMSSGKYSTGNLSAELNIVGNYKSSVVKLQAGISNIGSEFENLNILIDAKNILIDTDFKSYILETDDSPEAIRTFLREFDTSGIASVIFVAGPEDIQVTLDIEDANTTFSKFPYPISKLHGRFEGAADFWDLFNLQGITKNNQDVSIDVKIRVDELSNTVITASVKSDELSVEKDLVELLPEPAQKVLAEHKLSGTVAIKSSEFVYVSNSPDLTYRVVLAPVDVKYSWVNFPYDVNFNSGTIEIDNESVRFENLSGFNNESKITLNGLIQLKQEGDSSFDLKLDISNLAINDDLKTAIFSPLPEGVYEPDKTQFTSLWNMFQPGGLVNLELHISPGEERTVFAFVEIIDAKVTYAQFPLPIDVDGGTLEFSNFREEFYVRLNNITGLYNNEANILLEGTLQNNPDAFFLHIDAQNCRIDSYIKDAYEHLEDQINANRENKLKLWEMLKPAGLLNLTFDIYSSSINSMNISMIVDISEGFAEFVYFPYALTNVSGRVLLDSGGVKLQNIVGYHNETRIEINDGKIESTGYEVRQIITNSLIDRQFINAIPKEWQPLISTLNIRGRFNAVIEASISDITEEKPTIIYRLRFELPYNTINVGLEISDLTGVISIDGYVMDGKVYTVASIEYSTARWNNYKVTSGSMDLIYSEDGIVINNFISKIYEGVAKGRIELKIGENAPFSGYFKFSGIEVSNFLANIAPGATEMKGSVSGDFAVYGKTSSKETLQGIANFHVSDAWLMDVPIVLKLFDVVNYFNPTPINEAYGKIKLFSNRTEIYDLALYSDAIAIYGNGTIFENSNIDFKLNVDIAPRALFYPQPLRWFVKKVEKNVLPVYVVGKVTEPKINLVFPPNSGSAAGPTKKEFLPGNRPRSWKME